MEPKKLYYLPDAFSFCIRRFWLYKRKMRTILIIFLSLNVFLHQAQRLPAAFENITDEELAALYKKTRYHDTHDHLNARNKFQRTYSSSSSYDKIKSLALDIKFSGLAGKNINTQFSELRYISNKLLSYENEYGIQVILSFQPDLYPILNWIWGNCY